MLVIEPVSTGGTGLTALMGPGHNRLAWRPQMG